MLCTRLICFHMYERQKGKKSREQDLQNVDPELSYIILAKKQAIWKAYSIPIVFVWFCLASKSGITSVKGFSLWLFRELKPWHLATRSPDTTITSRLKKGIISIPKVVSIDPHQNSVTVDMVNSNKSSILFPKKEDAFIFFGSRDVRNCSKETANKTIHAI